MKKWQRWRERRGQLAEFNHTLDLHTKWLLSSIEFLHEYDAEAAHRLADNIQHRAQVGDGSMSHVGDTINMVLQAYSKVQWT